MNKKEKGGKEERQFIVLIHPSISSPDPNSEAVREIVEGHELLKQNQVTEFLNKFCDDYEAMLDEKDFAIIEVKRIYSATEFGLSEKTVWEQTCD